MAAAIQSGTGAGLVEAPATDSAAAVAPQRAAQARMLAPFARLTHPAPSVSCLAATKDFRWLYSGSEDGLVRRWELSRAVIGGKHYTRFLDAATAQSFGALQEPSELINQINTPANSFPTVDKSPSSVTAIAVHSEAVWGLSAFQSRNAKGVINLHTLRVDEGLVHHMFSRHAHRVTSLCIFAAEDSFLSASMDSTALLWSLHDGSVVRELSGAHKKGISIAALSPQASNQLACTAGIDGQIAVWDVRVQAPVNTWNAGSSVLAVCWDDTGKRLFVSTRNGGEVQEFNLSSPSAPPTGIPLVSGSGIVTALAFVPGTSQGQLLMGSSDALRIQDLSDTDRVQTKLIPGHFREPISSILIDPTNSLAATASGIRISFGDMGCPSGNAYLYEIKNM